MGVFGIAKAIGCPWPTRYATVNASRPMVRSTVAAGAGSPFCARSTVWRTRDTAVNQNGSENARKRTAAHPGAGCGSPPRFKKMQIASNE